MLDVERDRAVRALLLALLLGSEGCSSDPVIIGNDSTAPVSLGVGLAGRDTSGVDPSKRINELSADEAKAWCGWFSLAFPFAGPPLPEDNIVDPGGFVSGYGAIGCEAIGVCTEHLSVNHCVANLTIQPCQATLTELDDCVGVMWGLCQLPERCDAFLAAPSCLGSIVGTLADPGVHPICPIRVQ
jgi:hypothetical protein